MEMTEETDFLAKVTSPLFLHTLLIEPMLRGVSRWFAGKR